MIQDKCTVLRNSPVAEDYFEMEFTWPFKEQRPLPGQFLTVRPFGQALLRRPFAFSGATETTASIIYKQVGPATKEFAEMKEGDIADILGPVGTPFKTPAKDVTPILAAGGIGLGPMIFTAEYLAEEGFSPVLVVGARNKEMIPELKLKNSSITVVICTDDGSMGFKGNIVEYLQTEGASYTDKGEILACGPHPMLKACHNFAVEKNITCQVSLEEMMACAVGACYGCVVETTGEDKYKRVCKDGPVFDSREIKWT